MSKELQTLEERIAEKVGKELIDLIPEDEWRTLIDAQVVHFKNHTLPKIVEEMLQTRIREMLKEHIDQFLISEWDAEIQDNVNKKLEDFIGKSSGVIIAGMLSPAMAAVMSDLRNRLY